MAGKNWQAGGMTAIAATCLADRPGMAAPSDVGSGGQIGGSDPQLVWELLVGGFVTFAFVAALALWSISALRRIKRSELRKTGLVQSVLNHLSLGVVMVNARGRVVFCNDRYLEIYGLTRAELRSGMTGLELLELRRARGTLALTPEEFYANAGSAEGHITELPGGRSVLVKFTRLPNGASIATHDDCTEQRRLSKQLATTKQFLESVVDNIPLCVAVKSIGDGRYILANRAFERFARLSRDQIVGKRADEIFTAESAAAIDAADRNATQSSDHSFRSELVVDRGSERRILASNRMVARDDKDQPEFLVALFDDITERRSLSHELEETKKFLELVVDHVPISLTVERVSDGRYLLANRGAETILNRRREDATGLTSADIFEAKEARLIIDRDQAAIRTGGLLIEEHPIGTKDGLRLFQTRRVTVRDAEGQPQYLIKTHEDITDRRQTESRMAHMAYHDGLTDLPNRTAFLQALAQMIEACRACSDEFAVLSLDLDGLKEINDVFGHPIGDKLLIEVSRRIETAARGGVVARLSGDEFGLIIDGAQPKAAIDLAGRISKALASGFLIDGKTVRIGVTTGVAVFPGNGADAASLLANAGAALFRAKAKSRGSVSLFEPEMDQQIRDRRVLHQDLSAAILKGELSLHYQPQARGLTNIGDDEIIGFEALARWYHPQRGFVPPGDFIPLAEESGLIVEMGASWSKPLQIAVNLSPAQFSNGDLVSVVHGILLETGLQPGRLELEITEGVLIDDFDRGLALLRRLKALGVRVSMDDFGSGYSSLTYLQAFPFDKIKIDRTFVINLGRNPQSAAIIRAVIGLGHGLGISIVAEGVETQDQLNFLVEAGCDAVQGYFIGRPCPIEHYAELVGLNVAAADAIARRAG
jgi:diguanylate cyclase (GGDEF)-like protein/PAS domain S-box-containing protein